MPERKNGGTGGTGTNLPPFEAAKSIRIIDNSSESHSLKSALLGALKNAYGLDACVGYLHLRGWDALAEALESFTGEDDNSARVLVGMPFHDAQEMELASGLKAYQSIPDGPQRASMRRQIETSFTNQLTYGLPTDSFELTLRRLAQQLRQNKVAIRLFTDYRLHAKLYIVRRLDQLYPRYGIVGSSNLTAPGLWKQGELNVAIHDQPECEQLQAWFEERWDNPRCIDITELVESLISTGWPNEGIRPYLVYLRMAYHIAHEGIEAQTEFRIPKPFDKELFEFQKEAVRLAAHKLLRASGFQGVILADVVGLGKTYMASAILKIVQEDRGDRSLIICPVNLQPMWDHFVEKYNLNARVVPDSMTKKLAVLPGIYGCVVIDESHNFRNRDTRRWHDVADFITNNRSRVMLLSATPLNKHFEDLGSQLRLFVDPDTDLGVRPNQYIADLQLRNQPLPQAPTTIAAFEQSPYSEDWRELLRKFMVRRTRQYIVDRGFAHFDAERDRHFLYDSTGARRYFPTRIPRRLEFKCDESDPGDQYGRLYTKEVQEVIAGLILPRYGLRKYVREPFVKGKSHKRIVDDLGRAGKRLIGYVKVNLFKRLESSGHSFLVSIDRHILRNMVFVYALENGLDLPIGTQDVSLLDPAVADDERDENEVETSVWAPQSLDDYRDRARRTYQHYVQAKTNKFRWLPAEAMIPHLELDLEKDSAALFEVLKDAGPWRPQDDENLKELYSLLTKKHGAEKVLIFTQFADTANYLFDQLHRRGIKQLAVVTGQTSNPTDLAARFSPVSNGVNVAPKDQLRVLIATDVLSEGQNLQDAHIIVNYDLPWAIIRLTQRAGRVDRIGQENMTIFCYVSWHRDSLDKIINLRSRLLHRLTIAGEVLGTDEAFLGETVEMDKNLRKLYAEDPGILEDKDADVDLASEAMRVWQSATVEDQQAALALQHNSYATRHISTSDDPHSGVPERRKSPKNPQGVLVFAKYGEGNFAVARIREDGAIDSESLSEVLKSAACLPDERPHARHENHHALVRKALESIANERRSELGRLGPPRETRRKLFERMRAYIDRNRGTLLVTQELEAAMERVWRAPLLEAARDSLNRQMKSQVSDDDLMEIVVRLHREDALCSQPSDDLADEPRLVCSMGLWCRESSA